MSSSSASGISLPECPKKFYLVEPLPSDGMECLEKPIGVGDFGGVAIELSTLNWAILLLAGEYFLLN